jgi:Zn-dependent membrane protease YugP
MFAYAVSLEMNLTSLLWTKGIWFTENDVLHVGLILWVYYILKTLVTYVKDERE